MDLFNIEQLSELSDLKKNYYIHDVRIRVNDNVLLLYVLREKVGIKVAPGVTSERQLHNIQKKLAKEYDVNVEIIYVNSESHELLESACLEILNQRFNKIISALYISFINNSVVDIWLASEELTKELKEDIANSINQILKEANLELKNIQWINSIFELPSLLYILKTVKIFQPITLEELLIKITVDFQNISDKWLNGMLDKLRKKKLLSREKVGSYQLTELGLSALPSLASSNSLDIQRALALGGKKW